MDSSKLLVLMSIVMTAHVCSETTRPQCEDTENLQLHLLEGEILYVSPHNMDEYLMFLVEFRWYRNTTSTEPISTDINDRVNFQNVALIILELRPEDSGLYICQYEDSSEGCFNYMVEVRVYRAKEDPGLLHEEINNSHQNKVIQCPYFVHHTCVVMLGTFTWMKDFDLLESPGDAELWVYNATKEDEGIYTCTCHMMFYQKEYTSSGSSRLRVEELQMVVIPSSEGQTVTLMCRTSYPLTPTSAVYIWYKNGELLYEDWSPWYQELVHSDGAVRYSCAIKGHEDLRAPEVSVDSVSPTCFNVTYATGRMGSSNGTSVEEPFSITYPREVYVEETQKRGYSKMTCRTSCPLVDSQTTTWWYGERSKMRQTKSFYHHGVLDGIFSCEMHHLMSAEVCPSDRNCWAFNYVSRRICALRGSSVDISSKYIYPRYNPTSPKSWYKKKRRDMDESGELLQHGGRVQYRDVVNTGHILRITNLTNNDSGLYEFSFQEYSGLFPRINPNSPMVTLVVSGLKVRFIPSAEVKEGERVTLSCFTSCPLIDNTRYIWSLNGRPLSLLENQLKHLTIDPVSSQHAGKYSCAVKSGTKEILSSEEETLTVQNDRDEQTMAVVLGARATLLLVLIAMAVILWIRGKMTARSSPLTEAACNSEQVKLRDVNKAPPTSNEIQHPDESAIKFKETPCKMEI